MSRFGQVGIALGLLGVVIALMGLFPGMTGVEATVGIGVVQIFMLLFGYGLLVFGAIIYAKFTFFLDAPSTLGQQIGIRLTLTGLLFAALTGLADILGFGSHVRTDISDIFFGFWQAFGLLASLAGSSLGVLVYVMAGNPRLSEASQIDDIQASEEKIITQQMRALREEQLAALSAERAGSSDTDNNDSANAGDNDGSRSPQPVPEPAAEPDNVA
jgi:hypothetical protein